MCLTVRKKTFPISGIIILITAFTLFFSACGKKPERINITLGETVFSVEVARTPEERAKGLMHRKDLPPLEGMLFIFDEDQKLSFWMKNTEIPLSIAYISREGVIKEIHDMEPFSLRPVESLYYVRYALEVNRGAFKKAGVSPGYHILLPGDL